MSRNLMIQGTMSGAGKSILTAGILRILTEDGFRCAPFKSQNMALNSFVTKEGLEIGRAQALQAAACKREPSADMNPILLKPMGDTASQVIVNGLPAGNMPAREYFKRKRELIPDILAAYRRLEESSDIIVIEGAGSPVEINLRENDIVNMGLAEMVDAPVLLAGNIDPGGVFAQLLGTIELLSPDERKRVRGLIINKFRGDESILEPGLQMFKKYCDIPFAGVVPWVDLDLDEEDSISDKLENKFGQGNKAALEIAVIRLPFISNYTDFDTLSRISGVSLRYVKTAGELESPDLIIIPGSKNTIEDLKWMRAEGLEKTVLKYNSADVPVIGICGGFQMLGSVISDPEGEEGGGSIRGMGLLPIKTVYENGKTLRQIETSVPKMDGYWQELSGEKVSGYEIHMGRSFPENKSEPLTFSACGNVFGTYIHGLFDSPSFTGKVIDILCRRGGISLPEKAAESAAEHEDTELTKLAAVLREHLDMNLLYRTIGIR